LILWAASKRLVNKRIIEIGHAASLGVWHRQLRIQRPEMDEVTAPLEDLGVLVLDHPAIHLSFALLRECAKENIALIVNDEHHLPVGILSPLAGHSLHAQSLHAQVALKAPQGKRLWQAIVKAKIREQAKALALVSAHPINEVEYVKKVVSGDPSNIEAQFAKLYWPKMMGSGFRRGGHQGGVNACLDYGYALLRSLCARALCATGLHPALGLHHRNQYDAHALADDLMEPLRPLADLEAFKIRVEKESEDFELDQLVRHRLLGLLTGTCLLNGAQMPIFVGVERYAASLKQVIMGETKTLEIPEFVRHQSENL